MLKRGFTLIETIVVMGIVFLLLALVAPNFLNFNSKTTINTAVDTFITDLKNQQIKAMTGDTEGRGIPDSYSIYIQPGSYTLFHGANYSQQDTSNFLVPIDSQYQISTTFPSNKIIFASGSGEIDGFVNNQNSVTIRETSTGSQKVIILNKYGTVTQIN